MDEGKGRVGLLRSERVPDNNFSHGGDCLPAGVDGMKKLFDLAILIFITFLLTLSDLYYAVRTERINEDS